MRYTLYSKQLDLRQLANPTQQLLNITTITIKRRNSIIISNIITRAIKSTRKNRFITIMKNTTTRNTIIRITTTKSSTLSNITTMKRSIIMRSNSINKKCILTQKSNSTISMNEK